MKFLRLVMLLVVSLLFGHCATVSAQSKGKPINVGYSSVSGLRPRLGSPRKPVCSKKMGST